MVVVNGGAKRPLVVELSAVAATVVVVPPTGRVGGATGAVVVVGGTHVVVVAGRTVVVGAGTGVFGTVDGGEDVGAAVVFGTDVVVGAAVVVGTDVVFGAVVVFGIVGAAVVVGARPLTERAARVVVGAAVLAGVDAVGVLAGLVVAVLPLAIPVVVLEGDGRIVRMTAGATDLRVAFGEAARVRMGLVFPARAGGLGIGTAPR